MAPEFQRLPKDVKPIKYTVTLEPDLETFTFKGFVDIELDVVRSTNELKFHAQDLEIFKAEVFSNGNSFSTGDSVLPVKIDKEAGTAIVGLGRKLLEPGKARLHLDFQGTLNDSMAGFYRAGYMKDGKKHYMATTQFEATEARKALPCWDEPALKAQFSVTLIVPEGLTGLSNMPEESRELLPSGSTAVKFADTPVMSTYLLAFIIGDLEKVTTSTKAGVEVNVYTTPGNKEQGRFSLKIASEIITFFADYFGIDYPLPKADLVAVPEFAMGAMENWGLITFRDTALLVDEATSSAAACQHVAYVVSHELAHQWFGNLVTMEWWSDLWLNEGFATWVGWLGVDHVHPEWDVWTQFASSDMGSALVTDALLSSHPIEVPINDPKEITQVFDALSYRKGACVVRQLDAAVTPDLFKKGLRTYLKRHQWGNTVTNDLWKAVAEESGKPVEDMMRSWTQQMGYPLISVTPSPNGGVHLRQCRFLSKGPPTPEEDSQLWWVPITARAGTLDGETSSLPITILSEKDVDAKELIVPKDGWLKLNAGQPGFFRVNYTPELWSSLASAVQSSSLGVIDRLGIIMDAFALAKAGLLASSHALELAVSFKNETEYTVWNQINGDLSEVGLLLSTTEYLEHFEAVGCNLFSLVAEKVGWEPKPGESHSVALLRPLILLRLGSFGHKPTVEECRKRFKMLKEDPFSVPADLRRPVAYISVKYGGREEFEAVKELFRKAQKPDLKQDCLMAMGQTMDPELIKEYLEFGLDENEVKAQNTLYVFAMLSSNRSGREIQWDFVRRRWEAIYSRFKNSMGLIQHVVCMPLRGFSTYEKAQEAEDFFTTNPVPEAKMELGRTLETIRSRAAWLERDRDDMGSWLSKASANL